MASTLRPKLSTLAEFFRYARGASAIGTLVVSESLAFLSAGKRPQSIPFEEGNTGSDHLNSRMCLCQALIEGRSKAYQSILVNQLNSLRQQLLGRVLRNNSFVKYIELDRLEDR